MGEAGFNSLSVVSATDTRIIYSHATKICEAVSQLSVAIQEFLDWMNTQQRPAKWYRQVAIEFSNGLHASLVGRGEEHIKNVERTVWQVIQNPGWVWFEQNSTRNARRNIKAMEALATEKPESVTEIDEVSENR